MIFLNKAHRDDLNLLRKAIDGDAQSAKDLIHMLSVPAYSLAWKMLNDKYDAEDIVQEAFVRLWKSASGFNGKSKLLTYFYSIVRNLCLDKLRTKFKDVHEEYNETIHQSDDWAEIDGFEVFNSEDLQGALVALSVKQRTALLMWVYEEKTSKQIGQILGLNKNAIDQLLFRAKLKLKKELERIKGNQDERK
jgi:RNA polymerase sigma-70 factor (ECF subfamily)